MKQFKAESKRLLDLMINSIYTNKEIFLRELISNASDAIDKLYFESLTNKKIKVDKDKFKIRIEVDKDARTITLIDNGCGMDEKELESNLGTIAKSGSLSFKQENEKVDDVDILKIKTDTEEEKYDWALEQRKIEMMVKKYSDYIRYPIEMTIETEKIKEGSKDEYEKVFEDKILNSMVPIWKKDQKDVTEEQYEDFYREKYGDFNKPSKIIKASIEGTCSYTTLLFVPSHEPYDYYTPNFKKGLQLYSNGVLIMDKCEELLPDYYCYIKGLVDSPDLSLNISREILQHDIIWANPAENIKHLDAMINQHPGADLRRAGPRAGERTRRDVRRRAGSRPDQREGRDRGWRAGVRQVRRVDRGARAAVRSADGAP